MKSKLLTLAAIAMIGVSGIVSAEDSNPKPPQPPEGGGRKDRMQKFLDNLPPEARKRFEEVRAQALQDPKIQELRQQADKANGEFFKAIRNKMMEIDPGLAEIVKKQATEGGKGWKKDRGKGPEGGPGFGNLSEEERQKLMTAREKAKADPSVQAAEKKKDAAQTPDERKAAGEEYRKTMHEVMVKADPSIAPILEKIAPKPPQPAPPGPGGDAEMMQPQT